MSNLNKISIPKEVFENIFFKEGGQKTTSDKDRLHKSLTGEYQFPLDDENPIVEPNAEIEKGEYIFDSKGIRKAMGKTHENGGTPVKLEDGTRIISDHLKAGKELAKELNTTFGLKVLATDTYAKILDKFGKKIGLDEANEELEEYISALDKQKTNIKDEETYALNKEFLTKEINEYSKKKEPLEKQREQFFNYIFSKQEESKNGEKANSSKMEFGGKFKELASKYGISEERAMELVNSLPQHQTGTAGTIDGQDPELVLKANEQSSYEKEPFLKTTLPYTTRETGTNDIWKGDNYKNVWKPWVEQSMSNEAKAKKVDDYLTNYTGPYADRVKYNLKGLTGKARYDKIRQLATDSQPGPFHNAVLAALKSAEPAAPVEGVVTPEPDPFPDVNVVKKRYALNLPDQTPLFPPSADMHYMANREYGFVEPTPISQEKQLEEMDRIRLAAEIKSQDLPDFLRASQGVALTANANEGTNKVISDVNRFNAQAKHSTNIFNQGQRDKTVDAKAADAMDLERKTLMAKNITEQNRIGFYNRLAENQSRNWDTVNKFNAYNALNPDVQFTGEGYEVNPYKFTPNQMDWLRKTYATTKTPAAKFGGRFKK